jgi:predicted phosphodiesterase
MSIQRHEYTIPFPGVTKKVIYHFSDLHLAVVDPNGSPEEQAEAAKAAKSFDECRRWFADHCKEPFDDSLTATDYFEQLLRQCADGDAVLCAGDLVEHFGDATLSYVERAVAGLPFMTVCGNHDTPDKFPAGRPLSAAAAEVQVMDLGDLKILGFDDSTRTITPTQLEALKTALAEDAPLVILMHIPFAVAENATLLRGCGEYFMLNYDGCPQENLEFVELIETHPHRIVAVLAGHLHFTHTCPVTAGLTQYVSSQGMTGHIHRYVIGE